LCKNRLAAALSRPYKGKELKEEQAGFRPITVNIVKVYNAEHEWILLTNLPIDNVGQIEEIIKIYKSRWHIEDYFKILKTGYQVGVLKAGTCG
jgi:transposase